MNLISENSCVSRFGPICTTSEPLLRKFTHLKKLTLVAPKFSKDIFETFTNLEALRIKSAWVEFSLTSLRNLTKLDTNSTVLKVSDLTHLTNLTSLRIKDSNFDLTIIPKFPKLRKLFIRGEMPKKNIKCAEHLEGFGATFDSGQHISQTLSNFTNLKDFQLRGWFNEYSFVSTLTSLTSLDIANHTVAENLLRLPNLVSLSSGLHPNYPDFPMWLTKLRVYRHSLCDFLRVSKVTNLRSLVVKSPISDACFVTRLTQLTSLTVTWHSGIRRNHVQKLENLKKFTVLPPASGSTDFDEWQSEVLNYQ
jgi:hypothetical protein